MIRLALNPTVMLIRNILAKKEQIQEKKNKKSLPVVAKQFKLIINFSLYYKLFSFLLFICGRCDMLSFRSIPPGVLHLCCVIVARRKRLVHDDDNDDDDDKAPEVQTNFISSQKFTMIVHFVISSTSFF